VRKKLREAGIEILDIKNNEKLALLSKIIVLKQRGLSYQKIAYLLNVWRIKTAPGQGEWHVKTVRGIVKSQIVISK